MPRSKRDKKISLTQTKKKGLNFKQKLVEDIRSNVERFDRIFVFSVNNMRNVHLKDVRAQWKSSRFFFGKTKVMALALGKTKDTEVKKNLRHVASNIRGQCGLLLTNEEQAKVIEWFSTYVEPEFARSGFVATRTVKLPKGPVLEFKSSMEPELRKLGLPTEVKLGKTELRDEFRVCKKGEVLTPSQAQVLKLMREYMAEFRVTLTCVWSKDGTFQVLEKVDDDGIVEDKSDADDDDGNEVMEAEDT